MQAVTNGLVVWAANGGSDFAVTKNGGDWTVHAICGVDPRGRLYLLDIWRKQASSDAWVEAFCDMILEFPLYEGQGKLGAMCKMMDDLGFSLIYVSNNFGLNRTIFIDFDFIFCRTCELATISR